MEISKLILIIQFTFSFTCLLIQFYALFSVRWAMFESRVELGLIEEHGHYGLWSTCTYRRLIPAQVDEDGHIIMDPDCDPMDTFFTPGHPRAFISFFVICHTLALMLFCSLVTIRLVELYYEHFKRNELNDEIEMNPNKAKRFLVILSRLLVNKTKLHIDQEDYIRTQIRNKLYAISVAVLSTMLALAGALTPQPALRETDILRISNVAGNNFRVWRGPGFWAQLTTMIMDMLITTLIVIEVRAVFVEYNQQTYVVSQPTTATQSMVNDEIDVESDHMTIDSFHEDIIVNPFFQNYQHRLETRSSSSIHEKQPTKGRPTSVNLEMVSKLPLTSEFSRANSITSTSISNESNRTIVSKPQQSTNGLYINSEQVRQMKKQQQERENNQKETSYCNPMYKDD